MSELGSKIQSQVASEIDKGQREFFLRQQLKAIQDELGEGDEQQAEINELREPARGEEPAGARAARPPRASSPGSRSCRRPPPSTASSAPTSTGSSRCRGASHRATTSTSSTRAPDPRRGPLRPREGQGADHRVPRRLEAEERPLRPDPLLRRAAGRRQDLTRAVDRARARPEVRAHLRRRRPRRVGDPRATGARTSARCRARSSARSATPSRRTPSS